MCNCNMVIQLLSWLGRSDFLIFFCAVLTGNYSLREAMVAFSVQTRAIKRSKSNYHSGVRASVACRGRASLPVRTVSYCNV